jgi:hypothetical protein
MTTLLAGKSAIIYGAGGDIGGAVAFLASDGAGAITSGIVNATCGLVAG